MRVSAIHVDGYGVLSEFSVDDLSPGLNVLYGPNEAGKTTLLDFIRGVLFGFPDRRSRSAYHEPIFGGRHGGSLRLFTEDGTAMLVERHVGARTPTVTLDGAGDANSALARLLGGADDQLFASVFAFGLSELATFESLDRDEIRDVVFSAGVLGAGRSATAAIRELDSRSEELVRQRQRDAVANRLRRELDEHERALRAARAGALDYDRRRREADELSRRLQAANEKVNDLEGRAAELQLLIGCWPTWARRASAMKELEALGELDAQKANVAAHHLEIQALAGELSGHEERLNSRKNLQSQLDGIGRHLDQAATALGKAGDLEELLARRPPLSLSEEVAELLERHTGLQGGLRALIEDYEDKRLALTRQEQPTALSRDEKELRSAKAQLRELRSNIGERSRIEQQRRSEEREERLAALAHAKDSRAPLGASQLLTVTLVAVGLALSAIGLAGHHAIMEAVGLALTAGAAFIAMTRTRQVVPLPEPDRGSDLILHQLDDEIERLCVALSLDRHPSPGALGELERQLDEEIDTARQAAEHVAAYERAIQQLGEAERRLDQHRSALSQLDARASEIASELSLAAPLPLNELAEVLTTIQRAAELVEARQRVESELVALEETISRFAKSLAELVAALGVSDRLGDEDAARTLTVLLSALESAETEIKRREQLDAEIANATADLEKSLGNGVRAQRLEELVASGEVIDWQEQERRLAAELDEAREERRAIERDHQSALQTLQGLAASAEIADLELKAASVRSELGEALMKWLTYGVAKSLLDKTLERYERERQPEVIGRASELFAEVTEGRYLELIAYEQDQKRGIAAVTPSGHRVDSSSLSRGTAEQLYLCLRLGFATSFAEKSAPLPLVLDDVLVNFDPKRQAAMAKVIARVAHSHQVLALTCHEQVLESFRAAAPALRVVELSRR